MKLQRAFRLSRKAFEKLLDALTSQLDKDAIQVTHSNGGVIETAARLGVTLRILEGGIYLD